MGMGESREGGARPPPGNGPLYAPQPLSPLALARALIRIPSVTPDDHGCQALLHGPLKALGFTVHALRFGKVENLYARLGREGKNFCFAGHTDVVTAGDPAGWRSDPFGAHVEEGVLTGRGACDMKGGVAAMLVAMTRFLDKRPNFAQENSLSFLITGDEEGDAIDGTARVLTWLAGRQERLDYCLVGESTSVQRLGDSFKCGRRGSLNGTLILHGRQGHVAYPHLADNPIHRVASVLDTLAALRFDEGCAHFPETCLQWTNLRAGDGSSNVIPAELHATFNVRFNPSSTPARLKAQMVEVLDRVEPSLRYTLSTTLSGLPFLTADGPVWRALVQSIQEVTGSAPTPSTGGGTSDARFIAQVCPQTVEFGLLSHSIHQVNEWVAVDDLELLTTIYEHFLHTLFPVHPVPP